MLTEICQELRNWFERERYFGTFEISGGEFTADFLTDGQYYRILGSVFNDGVHKYGEAGLTDETFEGSVWSLGIPKAVIKLAEDIAEWQNKYGTVDSAAMSPFTSESFGGYTYSKGSGSTSGGGGGADWRSAFANRLNAWRKL